MGRNLSVLFSLMAALLLSVSLFGCGGDDDDSSSDDAADDAADDTAQADDAGDDSIADDTADDTSDVDDDGDYNCSDVVGSVMAPDTVLVPPGTFQMGSPLDEPGREDWEVQHEVTLTRGFYMMTDETTQALYKGVIGDLPGGQWGCGEDFPVGGVSWNAAVDFANALSSALGYTPCYTQEGETVVWDQDCDGYRLPTEAEWEYAARAGTSTAFYTGPIEQGACDEPNLDSIGWYCGNSGQESHAVGQLTANDWGLHDMLGNVWEWAWDGFDTEEDVPYSLDPATDPLGPGGAVVHAYRGGGIHSQSMDCRVAKRRVAIPGFQDGDTALRLVRTNLAE